LKVKKALKAILCLLLALVLLAGGYAAYVFLAWHRVEDNLALEPVSVGGALSAGLETGTPYRIVSYNVGFGAYSDDYGFFMDGGTESRARSPQAVADNLRGAAAAVEALAPDFALFQEVDTDGTRSWHIDETAYVLGAFPGRNGQYTFAQNYDSPYLLYPFSHPHGANRSGILTWSSCPIASGLRRSLPIESGFMKLLDLDRCYSVSRLPLETGGELLLYNLHLSAYTSDGTIATEQLKMLLGDMQAEYEQGNWCIAGGDFNKDLLGDSSRWFGKSDVAYTWAQPIPADTFDGVDILLVAPFDAANPVPSCRNADGPYHPGQYVLTVDGFLASPNVEVADSRVSDQGFRWSDHNPVYLDFVLRA